MLNKFGFGEKSSVPIRTITSPRDRQMEGKRMDNLHLIRNPKEQGQTNGLFGPIAISRETGPSFP
jgi:hypothetical protein